MDAAAAVVVDVVVEERVMDRVMFVIRRMVAEVVDTAEVDMAEEVVDTAEVVETLEELGRKFKIHSFMHQSKLV